MRLNKTKREEIRKRVKILIPKKNFIWYYKSYATWKDNQRQKENWSFNLLDTCQKESAKKINQ